MGAQLFNLRTRVCNLIMRSLGLHLRFGSYM